MWTTKPVRRGKTVCFTLDNDAEPLLRAMAANQRSIGLFLSELIRKEAREREQRPQLLASLQAGNGAEQA